MTKEQLGAFIAQQRKLQGMTQKDLAARLHITDKAVSKWERGLSYPDVTLLEPLAEVFGLGVEELVACKEKEEEQAVTVLMDISKDSLRRQKLRSDSRFAGVLVLLVLTALLVLYVTTFDRVTHERNSVFWTETVDGVNYVYLEREEHLLKLKCGDQIDFDAIRAEEERVLYYMDYTWNKRTYEGTLHACEESGLISLGGMGDAEIDDTVSACIFGEYGYLYGSENLYRNPYGDGYLCDYRFWYYTEDKNAPFLLVKDCLNATVGDTDGDGENEIIVRTYYVEKPYIIYDNTTGTIEPTYVDDIPEEFKEKLVCIWEQGMGNSLQTIAPSYKHLSEILENNSKK